MATSRTVELNVSAPTLATLLKEVNSLNSALDAAAKPRKIRAASAALPISEEGTGLTRGTAGAGRGSSTRDFSRQSQGLGGLVHLYATFAANIYAVGAAFNALSRAADFTAMNRSAALLSVNLGTSIKALSKDIVSLTGNAVALTQAMEAATLAASAKLNTTQIKELTKVARGASLALGRDMSDALNRVFRGTIKIEPELLDELAIMVKVKDANELYAKGLNKTATSLTDFERKQAFVNAVIKQGTDKFGELNGAIASNPFSQLSASIQTLSTATLEKINIPLGALVSLLVSSPTALLTSAAALLALLIKTAIPAISTITEKMGASQEAAINANKAQLAYIKNLKAKSIETTNEINKHVKSIVGLESAVKDTAASMKGLGSKNLTKVFGGLELSAKTIKEDIPKAMAAIENSIAKTQKELDRLRTPKKGLELISTEDSNKLAREITTREDHLRTLNTLQATTSNLSAAITAKATQDSMLNTSAASLREAQKAEKNFTEKVQRQISVRSSVEKTEALGFRAGFSALNQELSKGAQLLDENGVAIEGAYRKYRLFERGSIAVRGSLSILSTGLSKVLGGFSIFAATFAIGALLFQGFKSWMDDTGGAAEKLASGIDSITESMKTLKETQDKLSIGGTFSKTAELRGSEASLKAEAAAKYGEQASNLGKVVKEDWFTRLLNIPDKENTSSLKTSISTSGQAAQIAKDSGFQHIYQLFNFLDSKPNGSKDYLNQLQKVYIAYGKHDELLEKQSEKYKQVDSSLKVVTDLSNDYVTSLQNTSIELKASTEFSSAIVSSLEILGDSKHSDKVVTTINAISGSLETFTGVKLPVSVLALQDSLNSVDALYESRKNKVLSSGLTEAETSKQLKSLEQEKQSRINIEIEKSGNAFNELRKYSIDVTKNFGRLALASTRLAIAQASAARRVAGMKAISEYTGGGSNLIRAEELKIQQAMVRAKIEIEKDRQRGLKFSSANISKSLYAELAGAGAVPSTRGKNFSDDSLIKKVTEILDRGGKPLTGRELTSEELNRATSLANQLGEINLAKELADSSIKLLRLELPGAIQKLFDEINASIKDEEGKITSDSGLSKSTTNLLTEVTATANKRINSEFLDLYASYSTQLDAFTDNITEMSALVDSKAKFLSAAYAKLNRLKGLKKPNDEDSANINLLSETLPLKSAELSVDRQKLQAEQERRNFTFIEQNQRILELNRAQVTSTVESLSAFNELTARYSDLILNNTQNYTTINDLAAKSVGILMQEVAIHESLQNSKRVELQQQLAMSSLDEVRKEKLVQLTKLEQESLSYKLGKISELTDLYKQQNELQLKIAEESLSMEKVFSTKNMQAAARVMSDRIYETMGKSKSWISQFATGTVDALDSIADSFVDLVQRSELTFKSFADMVRNTFSDMIKGIASDLIKNGIKKLMLPLLEKIDPLAGKSSEQRASEALGISLKTNSTYLDTLNNTIQQLITAMTKPTNIVDSNKPLTPADNGVKTYPLPDPATVIETKLPGSVSTESFTTPIVNAIDLAREESSRYYDNIIKMGDPSRFGTSGRVHDYNPYPGDKAFDVESEAVLKEIVVELKNPIDIFTRATTDNTSVITMLNQAISNLAMRLAAASPVGPGGYYKDGMDSGKTAEELANSMKKPIDAQKKTTGVFGDSVGQFADTGLIFRSAIGGLVGALVSGGSVKGALAGVAAGAASSIISGAVTKMFTFADGGIMSQYGSVPLRAYASGGIATSPQLALYGEGSKNEAFVPLPDNRSIPVTLTGSKQTEFGDVFVTVNVNNTGNSQNTSVDVNSAKKLGASMDRAIKAAVQTEMLNQLKPGGFFNR